MYFYSRIKVANGAAIFFTQKNGWNILKFDVKKFSLTVILACKRYRGTDNCRLTNAYTQRF